MNKDMETADIWSISYLWLYYHHCYIDIDISMSLWIVEFSNVQNFIKRIDRIDKDLTQIMLIMSSVSGRFGVVCGGDDGVWVGVAKLTFCLRAMFYLMYGLWGII